MSFFAGIQGTIAARGCQREQGNFSSIDFSLCRDCEYMAPGPDCCFLGLGSDLPELLLCHLGHLRYAEKLVELFNAGGEDCLVLHSAEISIHSQGIASLIQALEEETQGSVQRLRGMLMSLGALFEKAFELSMNMEVG